VLVAPFLLVAALTGLLYAASFQAEKIVYDHELTVPAGDRKLPVSRQVAAAREAHPEGTVAAVRPSPEADATTRVMLSGVPGVDPGRTLAVFVDPCTAEARRNSTVPPVRCRCAPVDVLRFADYPVLAKLTRWGFELHTGNLFGVVNQIALMALALILMILGGYRMWWQRGRGSAFGRPAPRGAWQRVPPHVLVPLLAVIAVLGCFVPLLGVPLAAFLVVDVVLGEIAYRRGRRTYGDRPTVT
jgi:uncharacterized iron-regulated membrane protein